MLFSVVLHTDDGVRYGATVPDLQGCFSTGDTFDEALLSIAKAIDFHVETLLDDDQDIPVKKPIAEHLSNADYAGGVWAVVNVPVEKYFGNAEKINITLPSRLLAKIDTYAKSHGETRSGFLAQAARSAMQIN